MSTTILDRPVDLAPAEKRPEAPAQRDRLDSALLAVMGIGAILAVYGAITVSVPVLLTGGVVTAAVGLAYGLFTPVIPTRQ